MDDQLVADRLTSDAGPRSWLGLPSWFRYWFATVVAVFGTLASAQSGACSVHSIFHRVVDLLLHRAIPRPSTSHNLFLLMPRTRALAHRSSSRPRPVHACRLRETQPMTWRVKRRLDDYLARHRRHQRRFLSRRPRLTNAIINASDAIRAVSIRPAWASAGVMFRRRGDAVLLRAPTPPGSPPIALYRSLPLKPVGERVDCRRSD